MAENIFESAKEEVKEEVKTEVKEEKENKPLANPKIDSDYILKKRIEGMLGVENTSKYILDVERLLEYGKTLGYKNSEDIIYNVRELLEQTGSPFGDDKVKKASRMAYLVLEKQNINKEIERNLK